MVSAAALSDSCSASVQVVLNKQQLFVYITALPSSLLNRLELHPDGWAAMFRSNFFFFSCLLL